MERSGLSPRIIHGRPTRAFGRECAQRLIAEGRCDGAVCFNDLVALGMISGFAAMGRQVGQGFRLTGFDDIEEAAQSFPPLTTVHCGIADFGRDMAGTLMDWLCRGRKPPPETRTEVQLVVRASSAPRS